MLVWVHEGMHQFLHFAASDEMPVSPARRLGLAGGAGMKFEVSLLRVAFAWPGALLGPAAKPAAAASRQAGQAHCCRQSW